MGIAPSKTELYLPSETIRVCSPDRCFCNGGHRSPRYLYVERGGDGREQFHDPVEMLGDLMMGAAKGRGSVPLPWKAPGEWTVRDYERLTDIMNEWQGRKRGRQGVSPPPPYSGLCADDTDGDDGKRGRRRYPSYGEFERMKERVDEQYGFLFGTEEERRKEQYRGNLVRMMEGILPDLARMWATQQQGGMPMGGFGPPAGGMGGNGLMGMGEYGVRATGMGYPQMHHQMADAAWMGGVPPGSNPNYQMNPMGAANITGQSAYMGVNPNMMNTSGACMPGGNINNAFAGARGGFNGAGRRNRRQPFDNTLPFDDESQLRFDGHRGHGPFEHGKRSWDDDDMFGGHGHGHPGSSNRGIRGSSPFIGTAPRRHAPRPSDGGPEGFSAAAFEHRHDLHGSGFPPSMRAARPQETTYHPPTHPASQDGTFDPTSTQYQESRHYSEPLRRASNQQFQGKGYKASAEPVISPLPVRIGLIPVKPMQPRAEPLHAEAEVGAAAHHSPSPSSTSSTTTPRTRVRSSSRTRLSMQPAPSEVAGPSSAAVGPRVRFQGNDKRESDGRGRDGDPSRDGDI